MPLAAGTRLSRYEIRSTLGVGGMGEVYLAEDLKLGRTVAVKVLPAKDSAARQALGRFTQEARTTSALNHPHIVHVYEVDELDGMHFIVMEFVDGETLRERITRGGVGLDEALEIAAQVASALSAAHAAGVIHRDIKPANVIVRPDGYVKVLDFGLAKVPRPLPVVLDAGEPTASEVETRPGTILGTINYMSPEQARGTPVDVRADIWSLGVVLYEMIAGRSPFERATASDALAAILDRDPPPLRVPEAVEQLVTKALAKDPRERHQTAKELFTELRHVRRRLEVELELERTLPGSAGREEAAAPVAPGETAPSAGPMSSAEYLVGLLRRHRRGSLLTAAALLLAVAAAGYWAISRWPAARRPVNRTLSRLTFDQGLQNGPTWSPDGKWIAYSSNRGGNFDIWIQNVEGGNPIQVTQSPSADWQPDWSPDGKRIVFRSEGDRGGLSIMSPFGGELAQNISAFGYRPRWSPRGDQILFLRPGVRLSERPRAYVYSLRDNSAREILADGAGAAKGVDWGNIEWHPDGERVSYTDDAGAFLTVPVAGGQALKSSLAPEVAKALREIDLGLFSFRWASSGRNLYFEGVSLGVKSLWKVTVDPQTLSWVEGPERLTSSGLGYETDLAPSADGRRLAFTAIKQSTRIWVFPFDARGGRIKTAEGKAVTPPDVSAGFPDLSPDGKKLLYTARLGGVGTQQIWEKSLDDDREQMLVPGDDHGRFCPRWLPDSRRIIYSRFGQGDDSSASIVIFSPDDKREKQVTFPGRGRDYVYDVSPDGRWAFGSANRRAPEQWGLTLFPLAGDQSEVRELASEPGKELWAPRLSPDGRWVCFIAQEEKRRPDVSVIYVMPSSGGPPVRVTEEDEWADKPRWSPDGRTIYFIANYRSSFLNIWKVGFDPAAGRPTGRPERVTDFESPGRMISDDISRLEFSFNRKILALPIREVAGSIWVLDKVDQ